MCFIVKQVREERSLSKRRDSNSTNTNLQNNTMSRTSFLIQSGLTPATGCASALNGGHQPHLNSVRPYSQTDFASNSVKNAASAAANSAKHQNLLRK
jgi:hypothetical protein